MGLKLVHSAKQGNFVCPWCGSTFHRRDSLDDHWAKNPQCGRNRAVNSQLQQKYNVIEPDEPSEE